MWAEAVAELDRREQATERLLPAGQEWFYLHQPLKPRMRVPRLIRCNRVQAVGILATGGQLASANEINGENYSCSCSALHEHESCAAGQLGEPGRAIAAWPQIARVAVGSKI